MAFLKPTWEQKILDTLEGVPQDADYHAEGTVDVHTRMVAQAMVKSEGFSDIHDNDQTMLYWTTLLHDMAKPFCLQYEDGHIRNHGHAKRGSIMARNFLYQEGVHPVLRERICGLIRWHMAPGHALDEPNEVALWKMLRANLAVPLSYLIRHAKADMAGRISKAPTDNSALQIEAFEERVDGLGCRDVGFPWGNPTSRVEFFLSRGTRDPRYIAHEHPKCEMTMMSGLPGSGKDTWIKKNLPDIPMVSLDELRKQLGCPHGTNQSPVIGAAREQAKVYLRKHQSFVYNATNLTPEYRGAWLSLAFNYGARVRIINMDVPFQEILRRNKEREANVPESDILRMMEKWEPPDQAEAHEVWLVESSL